MHGPVTVAAPQRVKEIGAREVLIFAPLIALIFWIGLYPNALLRRSEASIQAIIERVETAGQQTGLGVRGAGARP
jgi:NADH:ubiquinone oxidoreductase subunit 4 (subunit M)